MRVRENVVLADEMSSVQSFQGFLFSNSFVMKREDSAAAPQ